MRSAAIYARYSSDNQKTTSIADQVSQCRRHALAHGIVVLDSHIYTDHAKSGARRDRQALSDLIAAGAQRLFDLILVDDLSRMARDLAFLLELVSKFRYQEIGIVSVADGIDTLDEEAILNLQIRGIFNEHFLRDLRKKTFRGQLGQKERGFFVGEDTFGYRSVPAGEFRMDKQGRSRPEGYHKRIDPVQAAVVRRIFRDFADGQALTRIMRTLNMEGVPGRFRSAAGWSVSTLGRMLDNTKYSGVWIWNKTRYLRDPSTGRRRSVDKPESEWVVVEDESLRIIDSALWDAVRRRRQEVRGTWPGGPGRRGFSADQRPRVQSFPPHLLSGAMKCGWCGATVGLVSGKGSGYYGCLGSTRGACENRVRVPRRLAEDIILGSVRERLLDPESLRHVFRRVEDEARRLYAEIPATLRLKTIELKDAKKRQANLVAFVAEGAGDKAVAKALAELEPQVECLEEEIAALRRASDKVIRAPSMGWMRQRLSQVRSVLGSRTSKSAALLRRLLCPIQMEPASPPKGPPYFVARTAIDTLELLEDPESKDASDSGAKSLRWWRRRESNPRPKIQHRRNLHAYPPLIVSLPAWKGGGNRRKPSPD